LEDKGFTAIELTLQNVRKRISYSLLLLGLLVLFIGEVKAASGDSIIASGQVGESPINESYNEVIVISKEDIELFNFQTLNEVLQYRLNNYNVYLGIDGYALNYLGTGRKNVRIMVNGLPIFPTSLDNFDLSKYALYGISRIEIVLGAQSIFSGTGAVLSSVNIITEQERKRVWSGYLNGNTSSKGDLNAFGSGSFNYGRHSARLSLGHYFFSGVEGADSFRVFQWKPKLRTQARLQYSYHLLKDLKVYINGEYFRSRIQDRGYPVINTLRAYDTDQRVKFGYVHAGIQGKISKYHRIDFSHSYTRYALRNDRSIKLLSTLETFRDANQNDFDKLGYDEYYNHLKIARRANDTKLNYETGMEFSHQRDLERSILSTVKTNITQIAFMGNLDWQADTNLHLKGGLRLTSSNKFSTPAIYSFDLRYLMAPNATLTAQFNRGFRIPTFNEQFYTFENPSLNISGNLNLTSETYTQYGIRLKLGSETSYLTSRLFWVNTNNGIRLSLVDAAEQQYQFVNTKSEKLIGQNLRYVFAKKDVFRGELGFSNNGINQFPTQVGSYYFARELMAKMVYNINSAGFSIGCVAKYQGSRDEIRQNALGNLEDFSQDDFWLVDISIRKQLFESSVFLQFGMKNLTNTFNVKGAFASLDRINDSASGNVPLAIDYGRRYWLSVVANL